MGMWNKLKEITGIVKEVIEEAIYTTMYTLKTNLYVFGKLIELSAPYIMWYITIMNYKQRGHFTVGGEIFLPVVILFTSSVLKKISNNSRNGYEIPVAKKRFTINEDFGEITINEEDLQEVILYLYDVENYIEKRGLHRWK